MKKLLIILSLFFICFGAIAQTGFNGRHKQALYLQFIGASGDADSLWIYKPLSVPGGITFGGANTFNGAATFNSTIYAVGGIAVAGTATIYEDLANYATSPDFVMTDTDVNLNVGSHVQAIDTSSIYLSAAGADAWIAVRSYKDNNNMLELINDGDGALGDSSYYVSKLGIPIAPQMTVGLDAANVSGQINFVASDNDLGNIAISTSDALLFSGFGSGIGIGGAPGQMLTIHGPDGVAGGPNIQLITAADAYPQLETFVYGHDNIAWNFDCYWNGSAWMSSDAGSNFQIYKIGDELVFNYGSGDNPGQAITGGALTVGFLLDTGGSLQIGDSIDEKTPSLKIVGDADSDAADVSETLELTLTPNATPTLATWDFTSTQSGGYTFDEDISLTDDGYALKWPGASNSLTKLLFIGATDGPRIGTATGYQFVFRSGITGTGGSHVFVNDVTETMKITAGNVDVNGAYNFYTDTSTVAASNAYGFTSTVISAYVTGLEIKVLMLEENTGACTIQISALGAKTIKKYTGGSQADLGANDIIDDMIVHLVYDGTNFQMLNPVAN